MPTILRLSRRDWVLMILDVGHYVRVAKIAERGKLDAIFLSVRRDGDGDRRLLLAVLDGG